MIRFRIKYHNGATEVITHINAICEEAARNQLLKESPDAKISELTHLDIAELEDEFDWEKKEQEANDLVESKMGGLWSGLSINSPFEDLETFVSYCYIAARRDGILVLENISDELNCRYLSRVIRSCVDGETLSAKKDYLSVVKRVMLENYKRRLDGIEHIFENLSDGESSRYYNTELLKEYLNADQAH